MKIIIWIVIITLVIIGIYIFIKAKSCNKKLLEYFDKSSVIVYGPKGSGKDLVFQKVIYLKRKKPYFANIPYGYKGTEMEIKKLSVDPNTFKEFIEGKITTIQKNDDMEGVDYYMSDGGVYLPSQYDFKLDAKYPSLPIFYALSRHLYNMNIHINTQNLTRIWKKIREQADKYIRVRKTINIGPWLVTFVRFYDKYESAVNNLLPMTIRSLNKFSKAQGDQYTATNGEIKNSFFILKKRHIKYDTRYYHKVLFGKTFKDWEEERRGKPIS